jgi:hypothetical protein
MVVVSPAGFRRSRRQQTRKVPIRDLPQFLHSSHPGGRHRESVDEI